MLAPVLSRMMGRVQRGHRYASKTELVPTTSPRDRADISAHARVHGWKRVALALSMSVMVGSSLFPGTAMAASELPDAAATTQTISSDFNTRVADIAKTKAGFNIEQFRTLLQTTASSLVASDDWVVPSQAYPEMYARDTFWTTAGLPPNAKKLEVLQSAVDRFSRAQDASTGQIPTYIARDGRVRFNDDESTMMFIMMNLELSKKGGSVDTTALSNAHEFLSRHVVDGRYANTGSPPSTNATDPPAGTFKYWADTVITQQTPAVITYNQGMYAVSLQALKQLGVDVSDSELGAARTAYASLVDANGVLRLSADSSSLDVSALAGDALSLYYFNAPLLSDATVSATLQALQRGAVYYPASGDNPQFLGFKAISAPDGSYLDPQQFYTGAALDAKGNYQNGASWLLYDALALYSGARHGVPQSDGLFVARLQSEVKKGNASHEFLRTSPGDLGGSDAYRDGYGWNAFVGDLIS